MVRLAFVVVLAAWGLGGCDAVFQLSTVQDQPILCGPFGAPTQQLFDPSLGAPNDLSVASDLIHGVVTAAYQDTTGPIPVVFDGTTWSPDLAAQRQGSLVVAFTGAHMVGNGDVYGWIDEGHDATHMVLSEIDDASFSSAWSYTKVNTDVERNLRVGNEVETDLGNGGVAQYVVQIKTARDGSAGNTIDVIELSPQVPGNWFPTGFGVPLDTDDVQMGVLTAHHDKLVYSAMVSGTSHLYESALTNNVFPQGDEIGLFGDSSIDQPWINDDCSMIWFRRDNTIWMATQ